MALELVIFDLAGTTVFDDRDVHKALQKALRDNEVDVTLEEANEVMGIPKPVAIEKLLLLKHLGKKVITEEWIDQIHQRFKIYMIDFYQNDASVREKEGVSELFSFLREHGIQVGVDTGFDRSITQPLLDRLGWERNDLIDLSITSDEVPRGRPFPDMIFKSMALTGVNNPEFVAKVGDTVSDLEEGTSAGCGWVIGVTDGAFSREQLMKGRATHLIDDVREVKTVFNLL
jgi:phosphonatase-like hydrolase